MTEDADRQAHPLSLEEWLAELEDPGELTETWAFPTDALKTEYLNSIASRRDDEVRALLRHFLITSGALGADRWRILGLQYDLGREGRERVEEARRSREFVRRLLNPHEPTWEGLTWILDLLPGWPMQAIDVLEAYFLAHALELPDGRIHGIGDAQAVIRAMWIGNPVSGDEKRDLLLELGDRRFEHVVESLYNAMGFETTLTPPARDGGRDVIAIKTAPGEKQRSLVECKLWRKPVGVEVVRSLLGVVSNERSTKGVIVTTSRFTKGAQALAKENSRVELLAWSHLLPLFDQYLGADWGRSVDWQIADSVRRTAGAGEENAKGDR